MTLPPAILKIPGERADQLRRLAKSRDVTIAEIIAQFVRREIAEGRLDDHLPGVEVTRQKDGDIAIHVEGVCDTSFERSVALGLANTLERTANPVRPSTQATLDLDAGILIRRVGTGVKLGIPGTDLQRILAPSIARDLATLIRKAAKQQPRAGRSNGRPL